MYPTISMCTSQSTNKMAANDGRPKVKFSMYRRFSNVNSADAIKIFDAGG